MSRNARSSSIAGTLITGVAVIVLAALLGFGAASFFGPASETTAPKRWTSASTETGATDTPAVSRLVTPFFFSSSLLSGSDVEAVVGEVRLASLAGLHQYVFRVPLPWTDASTLDSAASALQRIFQTDADAMVLLSVSLNPPEAWFAENATESAKTGAPGPPLPSLESGKWKTASKNALDRLLTVVNNASGGKHIAGYVLTALADGRWLHTGDYDRSEVAIEGFRRWLKSQYVDELALQTAWGATDVTFDSATVPDAPNTADTSNVFFAIPQEQRNIDYLRYLSESTADAVSAFAAYLRQDAKNPVLILVPYGYSFEYTNNDSGHNALGLVLDSPADGIISPVSYTDRGLGGAGGFMGAANSARYHGKLWFILDDTRTGISRNAVTGAIERIEGLRAEDVLRVQQRNYAAVLANGLGLVWDDTQGVGALHDAGTWELFHQMRNTYDSVWAKNAWSRPDPISYANPEKRLTLAVVIDEASRFFQRCDTKLNEQLLVNVRDCALKAGVPTQFLLLQDVLSGKTPQAAVYLFANAFNLHADDRNHLRSILIAQRSSAIWMYAPGYIDKMASADNISATTGHVVHQFDKPIHSGSEWQLSGGRWVEKGTQFGGPESWSPMFYIEAEDTKVMAKYRETGMVSIAAEFFPEGWGSIYIADPTLTPEMLREILLILEKHVFIRRGSSKFTDVTYFGPNVFAVHASNNGERLFDLGGTYNIQDLLDPQVGWQGKRFLPVQMRLGDTRILSLSISEATEQLPQGTVDEATPGVATDAAATDGQASGQPTSQTTPAPVTPSK